jgi:hypothetical protein
MNIFTFLKRIYCPECNGKFNYVKTINENFNDHFNTYKYIYCENYLNHKQIIYIFENWSLNDSILLNINNLQIKFIYNYDNGSYFFTLLSKDDSILNGDLKFLIKDFYKRTDGFDEFLVKSQDLINIIYKYNNNLIFI